MTNDEKHTTVEGHTHDDDSKSGRGKVSSACCQHPDLKPKKKKNPYAEGFAGAIAGEHSEKTDKDSVEAEAEAKAADEADGDMITEEKLLEELEIPVHEEAINLVQLRIFDLRKVALHTLTNCTALHMRQNLIHDLYEFPDNLKKRLVELDLYDNKIKKIDHFEALVALKILDLSYNNIRIIENLDLPNLEVLFLTENKITKIQNLDKLPKLKQLELGSNRIRHIEGLEHLVELEDLWLGKNKIAKLEGLGSLTKLRRLSLQANRLTEVTAEALKNNVNLTDLHLSENGLHAITHVAHLKNLRLIDYCFNPITKLGDIEELTQLQEFWITDARIADWSEVEKLKPLTKLHTVYMERNPVEDIRYRHKLATLLPWLKEIDSWPVAKRDVTGLTTDGEDPRGKWVDTAKAEVTFKASRGDAPIMPSAAEVAHEKRLDEEAKAKADAVAASIPGKEDVD